MLRPEPACGFGACMYVRRGVGTVCVVCKVCTVCVVFTCMCDVNTAHVWMHKHTHTSTRTHALLLTDTDTEIDTDIDTTIYKQIHLYAHAHAHIHKHKLAHTTGMRPSRRRRAGRVRSLLCLRFLSLCCSAV